MSKNMTSGSLCFPTRLAAAAPVRRLHRTTSLRRRATILTTKLLSKLRLSRERKKESYFKSLEAPPLGSWQTWPDSANHYAQRCRLHLP